jgi:Ca-activated chloride channel family protein
MTGGEYFRATDTDSLRTIYAQIDRLEKTVLEQPKFFNYREQYPWLVMLALLCLVVELALSQTALRVLP